MKDLHLTQEPESRDGRWVARGRPPGRHRRSATAAAKARVMAVFKGGVSPTFESFITKREDGVVCACAIGALAYNLGSELVWPGDKGAHEPDLQSGARRVHEPDLPEHDWRHSRWALVIWSPRSRRASWATTTGRKYNFRATFMKQDFRRDGSVLRRW